MITFKEYNKFFVKYYNGRKYGRIRFGQAFCNEFNIQDRHLFYHITPSESVKIILKKYVR